MFPDELFNFLDFDGGTIAFDVPKKVFYFLYVLFLPKIAPSKLKKTVGDHFKFTYLVTNGRTLELRCVIVDRKLYIWNLST